MDLSQLAGRTAVVTGAGSGIGRATAVALARCGADLALCDVDEEGLDETRVEAEVWGHAVRTRRVDVADADAMGAFAKEVLAETGAPAVLMNNAGVGLGARFLDTSLDDWDWILRINLRGVIHGCHHFLPRCATPAARPTSSTSRRRPGSPHPTP